MWQIIGRLIGALIALASLASCVTVIALAGVIMIYDARLITKKYFSFGDKNEATTGLKMLGTIVCVMGGVLVMFIK